MIADVQQVVPRTVPVYLAVETAVPGSGLYFLSAVLATIMDVAQEHFLPVPDATG